MECEHRSERNDIPPQIPPKKSKQKAPDAAGSQESDGKPTADIALVPNASSKDSGSVITMTSTPAAAIVATTVTAGNSMTAGPASHQEDAVPKPKPRPAVRKATSRDMLVDDVNKPKPVPLPRLQRLHTPSTSDKILATDGIPDAMSRSMGFGSTSAAGALLVGCDGSTAGDPVMSSTSGAGDLLMSMSFPGPNHLRCNLPRPNHPADNARMSSDNLCTEVDVSHLNISSSESKPKNSISTPTLSCPPALPTTPRPSFPHLKQQITQAPTIPTIHHKQSGGDNSQGQSLTDSHIYSNSPSTSPTLFDINAIPLPPVQSGSSKSAQLNPLSKETLHLFDTSEYMALWELRGLQGKRADDSCKEETSKSGNIGGAANSVSTLDGTPLINLDDTTPETAFTMDGTPDIIKDLSFTYPSGRNKDGIKSTQSVSANAPISANNQTVFSTFGTAQPVSANDFRSSYVLPMADDPFADMNDNQLFDLGDRCFSVPAYSISSPVLPAPASPTQKLIPRRPAPSPPTGHVRKGSEEPTTPLYAEINKRRDMVNDSATYCLADSSMNLENGFDNFGASYDSEDTLDDDSASDPENLNAPEIPCKLPISPSPRSDQSIRNGYLYKQGGKQNNKGWRRRYVTFDGHRLRYFGSEKSQISKKIIPIEMITRVENDVKSADSGKYRFRVVTKNRNYQFAAESLEDHHFWTQILMKAVIQYDKNNRGSMGKGLMRGGDMHTPDKEGFVKLNDNKRYMAIKGGKLSYYNNDEDFKFACPIHEVSLNTTSVKEFGKNKLQLITPYCQYSLLTESDADFESWKISIEDGIAASLSDDLVLEELYHNPSNRFCADCAGSNPHWAVLHLVTIVCSQCAGIHRQFWPFKVKSLRMDVRVWTKALKQLYIECGNKVANEVWEHSLKSPTDKISPTCKVNQRKMYILRKYLQHKFFKKISCNPNSQLQLNKTWHDAINRGNIIEVMTLVNMGADVTSLNANLQSGLESALSLNCPVIAEYLKHNGAEAEAYKDIWAVIQREHLLDENKVIKSGHLYKMHNLKKGADYPKQWIVLTTDSLSIFDNEYDQEPKVAIPCIDIINIAIHKDERGEPCFELLCNHGGQLHIYGAGEWEIVEDWMSSIISSWRRCWLWTKKKDLHLSDSSGTWQEQIDLRKVRKVSQVTGDESTIKSPAEEACAPIVLYLSDHYIYIASDLKSETDDWFNVINAGCKELSHHLEDQQLNEDNVPVLIEKCIDFIYLHGMTTEGIYRLSGTHSKVTNLLSDLINDARSVHLKLEDYTVHDVANVLKRYLRNLQSPVMCTELYGQWIATTNSTQHETKLYKYKEFLNQLPKVNYATLKALICHLVRVSDNESVNKMTKMNIATVFGPVLLSGTPAENPTQQRFMNTSYEIQLVIDLIDYYQWLFSIRNSELVKEKEILAKIQEIHNTTQSSSSSSPPAEFILGIYVINNLADPINMKVSTDMVAVEIVKQISLSQRIPRIDGYALYEIVCNGELERPLHGDEKVLDATLSYGSWNPELSRNNYLCVKEDIIGYNIEHVSGPDIVRFTDVHYCDKKSWRKMYFELNSNQLICYKDRSDNKVCEWDVCSLTIYLGVEKKRKPPTLYGITFLSNHDEPIRLKESPHLGRSICFSSEAELYTWLGSISYLQVSHSPSSTAGKSLGAAMSVSTPVLSDRRPIAGKLRLPSIKSTFKKLSERR